MNDSNKFIRTMEKIEDFIIVKSIRNGLIHIIPVLIIGAFALILKTFPIDGYQNFISTFLDGFFLTLFNIIYSATFGVLSVYMTYSISRSFMNYQNESLAVNGAAVIASLLSFFILAGAYLPNFTIDQMGPKSMFLAIITGLGASYLLLFFHKFIEKRRKHIFISSGDNNFNKTIVLVIPVAIVVIIFALVNALIINIFDVDSFRTLLINIFNSLFSHGSASFFKGFFFVLLSSILWFFGIHGSDTLENVMATYFTPNLLVNQELLELGQAPTEVLTKQFFDCFVLMGGCGSTICLLIAILVFSRNKSRKMLGVTAAFPMIFNINELMVFGLPIIFNPIMLIPFIAVPLVNYSVSYLALSTHLVPLIAHEIEWTTPVILGGYLATGSALGSLLQVVNIIIGVLIYFPFVKLLDKSTEEISRKNYDTFIKFFKENEQEYVNKKFTDLNNFYGEYSKNLLNDIKYNLDKGLMLAYQPQFNYEGKCIGAEALLRFKDSVNGFLYPPLVIKLAEEGGFLASLEEKILDKALSDRDKLISKLGEGIKLSINVAGTTVVTNRYIEYCKEMDDKYHFKGKNICIEITEQATINFNDKTKEALHELHELGLLLAIDDFSMGQTSINYLRDNLFDIIKLDGSLVKGLLTHKNTHDIIQSITNLAQSLNLMILAEFVDTDEKKEMLHKVGCDNYQGHLYSQAVFIDEIK